MASPEPATLNSMPSEDATDHPSQNGSHAEEKEPQVDVNGVEAPNDAPRSDPSATIADGKQKAKAVLAASGINLGSESTALQSGSSLESPPASTLNGGKKRSRSGSVIPTSPPPVQRPSTPRETKPERVALEHYVNQEMDYKALLVQETQHPKILMEKKKEMNYYSGLRATQSQNPGAVFGQGFDGYGNGRTDEPRPRHRLLYPSMKRPLGGRKSRPPRVSRKEFKIQAEQAEELVPIRLDIEWGKIKLRDTFTWNLNDRVTPPDYFAEKIVEDFGLKVDECRPLVQLVTQSISEQLTDFYPQIYMEEDPLDPNLPYSAYKNDEMRVLIKLNITIGQITLVDQFEWELNNPYNSPEEFATQMVDDLSLSGEFVTAIAHSIREQCQLFSKSLYITGHPFDGRPVEDVDLKTAFLDSPLPTCFRPHQMAAHYQPALYDVNEAELERMETAISRDQRRQKRSTNRRGGPALPDLKERPIVIRSSIVSSVIPGAAQSLDESRIFKVSRKSRRSQPGLSRGDGVEDSGESDSDESAPDSPAIPTHLLQGTARTRGIRNAASAAQAAMRANLSGIGVRSATPESTSLHHESRTSRSRRDYREESSEEPPDKYIIKLKISRQKYREWMRNHKAQQAQRAANPVSASPFRQTAPSRSVSATPSAQGTPAHLSQANSNMPPPSMTAQSNGPSPARAAMEPVGVVDAMFPPSQAHPAPNPPTWLTSALAQLKRTYPRDHFEATMRYTAVDASVNPPVPLQAGSEESVRAAGKEVKYQYHPRIRCSDCPGKLYTPGPGTTVENFEVHLKNRNHREKVERRLG
ncbi:MAG: hypothetical protein Q9227_008695 [Pyrenula ochraceoflavens]